MRSTTPGARAFVAAAIAATLLMTAAPATPAVATGSIEASQVISIAKAQRGDPWRYGATGPYAFDCSGLVIYAYKMAGDLRLIGNGNYRTAAALYKYFRDRGKTSRTKATPGDLVVWGYGKHIGIYLGGGMAISTLSSGVRIHAVSAVTLSFTAYLRTGIYQLSELNPITAVVTAPHARTSPAPLVSAVAASSASIRTISPAGRTSRISPAD